MMWKFLGILAVFSGCASAPAVRVLHVTPSNPEGLHPHPQRGEGSATAGIGSRVKSEAGRGGADGATNVGSRSGGDSKRQRVFNEAVLGSVEKHRVDARATFAECEKFSGRSNACAKALAMIKAIREGILCMNAAIADDPRP